jgi:hypothetical protein
LSRNKTKAPKYLLITSFHHVFGKGSLIHLKWLPLAVTDDHWSHRKTTAKFLGRKKRGKSPSRQRSLRNPRLRPGLRTLFTMASLKVRIRSTDAGEGLVDEEEYDEEDPGAEDQEVPADDFQGEEGAEEVYDEDEEQPEEEVEQEEPEEEPEEPPEPTPAPPAHRRKAAPTKTALTEGSTPTSSQPATPKDEEKPQPRWMREDKKKSENHELAPRRKKRGEQKMSYQQQQRMLYLQQHMMMQQQQQRQQQGGGGGGKDTLKLRL